MSGVAVLYGFSNMLIILGTFLYCAAITTDKLTSGKNFTLIMLLYGLRLPFLSCFDDLNWQT